MQAMRVDVAVPPAAVPTLLNLSSRRSTPAITGLVGERSIRYIEAKAIEVLKARRTPCESAALNEEMTRFRAFIRGGRQLTGINTISPNINGLVKATCMLQCYSSRGFFAFLPMPATTSHKPEVL